MGETDIDRSVTPMFYVLLPPLGQLSRDHYKSILSLTDDLYPNIVNNTMVPIHLFQPHQFHLFLLHFKIEE